MVETMDVLMRAFQGSIRNILFVCDTADDGHALGEQLNAHGYRVIHANNIQQAVDCLATSHIDIVYMDLVERLGNRQVIMERLKHHLAGTPLIVATDTPPDQSLQPVVFIQRPIDSGMLLRIIQFPAFELGEDQQDQTQWLHDVNTNLRFENGRLHDTISMTRHEWRSLLAQLDILLAKLSHPGVGTLGPEQQTTIDQIREVTDRMEQITLRNF
jgi:CheY-like chemotaxis protein